MRRRGLAGMFLVAMCMAVCMVAMGCGASDEYASVPEHPTNGALPPSTIRALQACAEERAGRLQRRAYEIEFGVELKGDRVREVTPKGPRLDDAGLERCMIDALWRMADAGYSPDPDGLISRGGLLPTRGLLANTSVLPQMVRLIPVVVGSSGTLIVVAVAVVVVVAVLSSRDEDRPRPSKEECKKIKEMCINECADTVLPRGDDGSAFRVCQQECLERHGCPRHS